MNSYFKLSTLFVTLTFTLFFSGCINSDEPFNENVNAPLSLQLTISKDSLNLDENTTLQVTALYDDNTSQDVSNEVEWISSNENAVEISKNFLHTKQDTNITLQAKLKGVTSNAVALEIYKEINGHRLPAQPDETLNNSTLLGIDVNNNGVRDDVERWIYETYKDKHPVHIDIAMQAGRAWQKVLEDPTQAKEIYITVDAVSWCEGYYKIYAKYFNEPVLISENINSKFFRNKIVFNTNKRLEAYLEYDRLLSGDTYSTPSVDRNMSFYCDFNTSEYEK